MSSSRQIAGPRLRLLHLRPSRCGYHAWAQRRPRTRRHHDWVPFLPFAVPAVPTAPATQRTLSSATLLDPGLILRVLRREPVMPAHELMQGEGDFVGMRCVPRNDALELEGIIGDGAASSRRILGPTDVSSPRTRPGRYWPQTVRSRRSLRHRLEGLHR